MEFFEKRVPFYTYQTKELPLFISSLLIYVMRFGPYMNKFLKHFIYCTFNKYYRKHH